MTVGGPEECSRPRVGARDELSQAETQDCLLFCTVSAVSGDLSSMAAF